MHTKWNYCGVNIQPPTSFDIPFSANDFTAMLQHFYSSVGPHIWLIIHDGGYFIANGEHVAPNPCFMSKLMKETTLPRKRLLDTKHLRFQPNKKKN